jgi:Protein of unknown function (DUF4050)
MADEETNPSRTVDAAIQPNEIAIYPKASVEMAEEAMHQDSAVQRDEEKENSSATLPAVETRPAVVEEVEVEEQEQGICDQEDGVRYDSESALTTTDLVNIVDPPTSSDEATSEITNGDNADPPLDDVDGTASDIVLSTVVNTTISSSPLMDDQEGASCPPGDDVQSTQDRPGIVENPVGNVAAEAAVETGDLPPHPIVDDSAAVTLLSELPAVGDEGENGEILKPQLLASNAPHDGAPAAMAGKAPSPASTPLQRTRGDEENVGENVAVNEVLRPDEENHNGDGKSFVNHGFALWEQSRQQWLHRREVGESRNSDGSPLVAIPLDVVRIRLSWSRITCRLLMVYLLLTSTKRRSPRTRLLTLCSRVPSRYAKRVDRGHSLNLSLFRK